MKVVYQSNTGNVRRFAKKLNMESIELDHSNVGLILEEPYLLLVPTYEPEMLTYLLDFIEDNADQCVGIVGSGNYNFGKDLFCYTANDLAKRFEKPIVTNIELVGNSRDITKIEFFLENLRKKGLL